MSDQMKRWIFATLWLFLWMMTEPVAWKLTHLERSDSGTPEDNPRSDD